MALLALEDDPNLLNVSLSSFEESGVFESRIQERDIVLTRKVTNKTYQDGSKFTGLVDAVTGELVHGKLISKSGKETYEGSFRGSQRHGNGGVLVDAQTSTKTLGRFENDSLVDGTRISKDFSYSGSFLGDKFHGKGKLALADKSFYHGNFRFGKFQGQGCLTDCKGNVFEGCFFEGRRNGAGLLQYHDGGFYDGEWNNDMKQGTGIEVSRDGKVVFEGKFHQNRRNGKGRLQTKNFEMSGQWREGHMQDIQGWRISYVSVKLEYEGGLLGGHPHGNGTLKGEDGVNFGFTFIHGLPAPGQGPFAFPENVEMLTRTAIHKINKCKGGASAIPDVEPTSDSECSSDGDHQVYAYSNGDTYTGPLDDGLRRQGHGIYTHLETGTVYDGEWKDSERCGKGTISCRRMGFSYVGKFRNDLPNGLGVVTLMDGSSCTGEFVDGKIHGNGTFTDQTNQVVFQGDFRIGLKNGRGEETCADGTLYSGEFLDGKRCGTGRLFQRKTNEVLYSGEWKDDHQNGEGEGTCTIEGRSGSYRGGFKNGLMYGRGALTTNDEHIYEGTWANGCPVEGEWVITFPSGSVFYGAARCKGQKGLPLPNGFGSQRDPNGEFYTGSFRNGLRHGSGLCVFETGEAWDGRWENGIFVKYGKRHPS